MGKGSRSSPPAQTMGRQPELRFSKKDGPLPNTALGLTLNLSFLRQTKCKHAGLADNRLQQAVIAEFMTESQLCWLK
jgi:hypothetical protein